jgi:tetratricopeptide (TPR) repeat protein
MLRTAALSLVAILALPTAAHALDKWVEEPDFSVSPKTLLKAVADGERHEGTTQLLQEERVTVDEEGRTTLTWRRVFAVHTPGAVEAWGTLHTGWAPWHEEKPEVRARVIAPDGTVTELDPSTIREGGSGSSGGNLLDDAQELQAPLPNLVPGSVVEQVVIHRDHAPFVAGGARGAFYLSEDRPLANLRVEVSVPKDVPFTWALGEDTDPDLDVDKLREKGRQGVVVAREDVPIVEAIVDAEPSRPLFSEQLLWSTHGSWEEAGARYAALQEPSDPEAIADWVAELEQTPKGERLTAAITMVRDRVRYTGLEFGQRAIVAWPAGEIIERGYGDCKDKAVLLSSLLTAVGIDAHLALIRTWPKPAIHPDVPGLAGFNHAIVHVPEGPDGEPMWIDATLEHALPGVIPRGLQGRHSLVLFDDGAELLQLPHPTDGVKRWQRIYEVPALGAVRVREVRSAAGSYDLQLREGNDVTDTEEVQKGWDEWIAETWSADGPAELTFNAPRDLSTPYTFQVDFGEVGVLETDGSGVAVELTPQGALEDVPDWLFRAPDEDDPIEDREEPVYLWPQVIEDTWTFRWDPLYEPDRKPVEHDIHIGPLHFTATVREPSETELEAVYRFELDQVEVPVDDVKAFRKAWSRVEREFHEVTLVEPGMKMAEQGDWTGALTHYAGLDNKPARYNRVTVLRQTGQLDAARRAAEELVEAWPDDETAWSLLGVVTLSNRAGQADRPPYFDIERAREVYAELDRIDGEHGWKPARIRLLATDEYGSFPTAEGVDDALEVLDAWEEEAGERTTTMSQLRLQLLARQDRWEEIAAHELQDRDTISIAAHQVAALAIVDGPRAGVADAQRRVPQAEERARVLSEAVVLAINAREYEAAGGLAEAVVGLSGDPQRARVFASIVSRLTPYEDRLKTLEAPAAASLEATLVALDPDLDEDQKAERLSGMVAKALRKDDQAFEELLDELSADMSAPGFQGQAMLDFAASLLEVESVSGDKDTGYRVVFTSALGAGTNVAAHLVHEGGRPRLRAVGNRVADMGAEALARLDKGDEAAARQWLDWAAEQAGRSTADRGPHGRHPGLMFWTPGQSADDNALRRAAVVFAGPRAARDLRALPSNDLNALQKAALGRARIDVESREEAWDAVVSQARALTEAFPGERAYQQMELDALGELEDLDTLEERVRAYEAAAGDVRHLDPVVLRWTLQVDPERGVAFAKDILSRGGSNPGLLNSLAWHAPRGGIPAAEALPWIEKATEVDANSSRLHTLAALQLLDGQTDAAIASLRRTGEQHGPGITLASHWMMVHGGVALALGFEDDAEKLFAEIDEDDVFSLWYADRLREVYGD